MTDGRADDAATVFVCRRCGECCTGQGGIVLRGRDQKRLADALKLSLAEFQARCTERRGGKLRLRSGVDGACIFHRVDGGCGVHGARPDICRAWPFFRGNLIDSYSFALAKEGCPGILPEASFERFARVGKACLLREGLAVTRADGQSPNALIIDGDGAP